MVRGRHAAFYVALTRERARPELRARELCEWLERARCGARKRAGDVEHQLESGDADGALRLSGSLAVLADTRSLDGGRRY